MNFPPFFPQADVRVGDMILACNTETFLGIGMDDAMRVLKESTGNVRILCVSPNEETEARKAKKEEEKKEKPKEEEKKKEATPKKEGGCPFSRFAGEKLISFFHFIFLNL